MDLHAGMGVIRYETPKCTGQLRFTHHCGQWDEGQGYEISKKIGNLQVVEEELNTCERQIFAQNQ